MNVEPFVHERLTELAHAPIGLREHAFANVDFRLAHNDKSQSVSRASFEVFPTRRGHDLGFRERFLRGIDEFSKRWIIAGVSIRKSKGASGIRSSGVEPAFKT